MRAELQALSPLVPIREVNFLRFCKKLAEGVWVVADVSIDGIIHANPSDETNSFKTCRKLPSGCVIQGFPNGQSKVYIYILIDILLIIDLLIHLLETSPPLLA